ncbi:MAG: hypothetical protein KDD43_06360, partial [Bdellovibrionales bacterium]|nr:hypothetical protein [Bdellovibrionales bacterium]
MTYGLGKLLQLFIEPVFHWCALALLVALVHRVRLRVFWGTILVSYILVVSVSPLPFYLLRKLESQYSPPAKDLVADAVVVLGGTSFQFNRQYEQFHVASAAER